VVPDELLSVLTRFHREVVVPDIERIVNDSVGGVNSPLTALRQEMLSHFDGIYRRFDRLESEYQAVSAALKRLEDRVAAVEQKLDRLALRTELVELKARVATLEDRIAQLESEI